MDNKKVKITDVAKKAGVSSATVSMVMAGNPRITEKTQEIVSKAIQELGYKKQRNTKPKKNTTVSSSKIIGLITYCDYPFQWWFTREFVLTIKNELLKHGYLTVMFYCNNCSNSQELYSEILGADLEGLIVLQYNDAELFSKINALKLPMVLINNSNFQFHYHSVCADDFQGAYDGTKKLIENGHKDIAFLEFDRPNQPSTILDRYFGFRKAMEEYSLPFPSNHKITVQLHDLDELYKKMKTMLEDDKKITGFFVHDDYFSLDVIEVLKRLGKTVPEDFSLVAPGDTIPYEEPFVPKISTIQLNRIEMSIETVNMLIDVINGKQKSIGIKKSFEKYIDRGTIKNIK